MSSCSSRQWKAKAQPPQAEHQPNLPALRAGNGFAEEASAAAPSGFDVLARQDISSNRQQRHRHQSAAWGSWSNYGYGYGYYQTQDPTWSTGPWQSWPTWNPADGYSNSEWFAGPQVRRSGEFRVHRRQNAQAQSVDESIPESASVDLRPEQLLRRSPRQSEGEEERTPEHSFAPPAAGAPADADGSRPSSGFVETTMPSAAVEDAAENNALLRPDALSAPIEALPHEDGLEGLSEEPRPRSWLTGAPDALAYIEDFLAHTEEPQVVEDWEDMAEDLAEDREPPWYNVPYLLRYRFRKPTSDSSLEGLPKLGRRPKPAVPARVPGCFDEDHGDNDDNRHHYTHYHFNYSYHYHYQFHCDDCYC
ncbi:hypothetical protein AK812_SmicGene11829 [Symbiodinium microadriaticum]|uniref:Uncharacterized protein n=1 Tax=Symbiodinium microadriaticum TaxID=2951 RepID=A0A1Q9ECA2_SYMMI|nr:hypothetical protein AK812_SmicGene11829 [Symbiodinium microadriaticum]